MDNLQPNPILQTSFQDPPWSFLSGQKLPGIGPVEPMDWLRVDEAFAPQMALRDRLLAEAEERVYRVEAGAEDFAQEALDAALDVLRQNTDYQVGASEVTRPDGVKVEILRDAPLYTLGRLVQEDICLLAPRGDEYCLVAAVLCFPASWSLAEKIGRPMSGVHEPVEEYDPRLTNKVERMLRALKPGQTIRRANCLLYHDHALFQPRKEDERRARPSAEAPYARAERQCLLKLPKTEAVLFSIHTNVVARSELSADEREALDAHLGQKAPVSRTVY